MIGIGHMVDLFHIFHIQLHEHPNGTCILKAAAKGKIVDLAVG